MNGAEREKRGRARRARSAPTTSWPKKRRRPLGVVSAVASLPLSWNRAVQRERGVAGAASTASSVWSSTSITWSGSWLTPRKLAISGKRRARLPSSSSRRSPAAGLSDTSRAVKASRRSSGLSAASTLAISWASGGSRVSRSAAASALTSRHSSGRVCNSVIEGSRMDKILLRGLVFYGFHGVNPEEQALGQRFRVDVTVWADLAPAAASDAVADTVSYATVYKRVRALV